MTKRIFAFVMAISMVAPLILSAQSATSPLDDARQQQKQIQSQKDSLSSKKKEANRDLLNNKQVRDQIISELEQKGFEKEQIEAKIKEIEGAIQTLDTAIQNAQADYDKELALFQKRLVVIYIHSRLGTDTAELAESASADDLFQKLHTMKLISKADQDMKDEILQKKQIIEDMKAQREQEQVNAEDRLNQSLSDIKDLEVSRSEAEDSIAQSEAKLAEIAKREDELDKEDKELGALIKKLMSSGKYNGGTMQWPLPGYVPKGTGSYFGNRMHPILRVMRFHNGIDIGAPKGTYIHAAASGKVIWAGWRSGGSGNTVIIDHGGGIATLYLHIMSGGILVQTGQVVTAGDVIAKVGSTGLSTGPHLHFTVKKDGEDVDPLKYVTPK